MKIDKTTTYILVLAFVIIFNTGHILWNSHRIGSFMNAGARFTMNNGKELCARIQRIEEKIYMKQEECQFSGH